MKKFVYRVFRAFGVLFYELAREDFSTPCPWDDNYEESSVKMTVSSTSIDGGKSWQGGRFGNPTVSFREAHGHDCPTCSGRGMGHMGNPPCPTCNT